MHHLQYLITPNNASVFVVASSSNWCGPPSHARSATSSDVEAIFQAEVRRAFHGWHDLHAALIPSEEGGAIDGAYAGAAISAVRAQVELAHSGKNGHYGFVTAMMRNWRWQCIVARPRGLAHRSRSD